MVQGKLVKGEKSAKCANLVHEARGKLVLGQRFGLWVVLRRFTAYRLHFHFPTPPALPVWQRWVSADEDAVLFGEENRLVHYRKVTD